jgi:hypothetical protein
MLFRATQGFAQAGKLQGFGAILVQAPATGGRRYLASEAESAKARKSDSVRSK